MKTKNRLIIFTSILALVTLTTTSCTVFSALFPCWRMDDTYMRPVQEATVESVAGEYLLQEDYFDDLAELGYETKDSYKIVLNADGTVLVENYPDLIYNSSQDLMLFTVDGTWELVENANVTYATYDAKYYVRVTVNFVDTDINGGDVVQSYTSDFDLLQEIESERFMLFISYGGGYETCESLWYTR